MKLGTTYICVSDFEKSLNFYQLLLQQKPLYCNEDRWATFACGNTFSLYNEEYDKRFIKENDYKNHFNQPYLDILSSKEDVKKNNLIVLNFEVDDLKAEYQRIKELKIGEVSKLLFVNIHHPYWYFNIIDPDGNVIEITGFYVKKQ